MASPLTRSGTASSTSDWQLPDAVARVLDIANVDGVVPDLLKKRDRPRRDAGVGQKAHELSDGKGVNLVLGDGGGTRATQTRS